MQHQTVPNIVDLQQKKPTRVTVVLKKTSPLYPDPPDAVVQAICSALDIPHDYNLLVVQKWQFYTILVFDILHSAYDSSTAHFKIDIPVLRVDHSGKGISVLQPSKTFQDQVNDQVAKFHNLNGWDGKPPYYEDQTSHEPRRYFNPRDTSIL